MNDLILITNAEHNIFDFELDIQGIDRRDAIVNFVIQYNDMDIGFKCVQHPENAQLYTVTVPKLEFINATMCNYRIEVIINDIYFKPHVGALSFVQKEAVVKTASNQEGVAKPSVKAVSVAAREEPVVDPITASTPPQEDNPLAKYSLLRTGVDDQDTQSSDLQSSVTPKKEEPEDAKQEDDEDLPPVPKYPNLRPFKKKEKTGETAKEALKVKPSKEALKKVDAVINPKIETPQEKAKKIVEAKKAADLTRILNEQREQLEKQREEQRRLIEEQERIEMEAFRERERVTQEKNKKIHDILHG